MFMASTLYRGGSRGGDGGGPPKIGKNMIFWPIIVIFPRNTPTNFAPPSAIGKNMIFWRKIVIFHTKYLKHFRASLRSAHFFKMCPLT